MHIVSNNLEDKAGEIPRTLTTPWDYAVELRKRLGQLVVTDDVLHLSNQATFIATDDALIRREALRMLPDDLKTRRFVNEVVGLVKVAATVSRETLHGHVYVDAEGFLLISCANCVLSLSPNGPEVRPTSPSYMFTAATAAAYRPNGGVPHRLEQIEAELLPDQQDRDLLHLMTGYSLIPHCRQQCGLFAYGETQLGKSTLLDAYATTFGESLVGRVTLTQLASRRGYHVPRLANKALNIGREIRAEKGRATLYADILREIIDGSTVEARKIRGKPFSMHHSVKLVFCGNHLPAFADGNEADARRWRFLHFNRRPAQIDPDLLDRLALEKDAIFTHVMVPAACRLLGGERIHHGGNGSQSIWNQFRILNDPLGAFVADCGLLDGEGFTPKDVLLARFHEWWMRVTDHPPMDPDSAILKNFYQRFPSLRPRRMGTDERVQVVAGIRLREQTSSAMVVTGSGESHQESG